MNSHAGADDQLPPRGSLCAALPCGHHWQPLFSSSQALIEVHDASRRAPAGAFVVTAPLPPPPLPRRCPACRLPLGSTFLQHSLAKPPTSSDLPFFHYNSQMRALRSVVGAARTLPGAAAVPLPRPLGAALRAAPPTRPTEQHQQQRAGLRAQTALRATTVGMEAPASQGPYSTAGNVSPGATATNGAGGGSSGAAPQQQEVAGGVTPGEDDRNRFQLVRDPLA